MAALLKQEFAIEVELIAGDVGEFNVLVDDQIVASMVVRMKFFRVLPKDQEVVLAVRQALGV